MAAKKYTFFSDPGHGWLSVPMREIAKLHIGQYITRYSYRSRCGGRVYLEEDCDLNTFINAVCPDPANQKRWFSENVRESYSNSRSRIRSLPSFNYGDMIAHVVNHCI